MALSKPNKSESWVKPMTIGLVSALVIGGGVGLYFLITSQKKSAMKSLATQQPQQPQYTHENIVKICNNIMSGKTFDGQAVPASDTSTPKVRNALLKLKSLTLRDGVKAIKDGLLDLLGAVEDAVIALNMPFIFWFYIAATDDELPFQNFSWSEEILGFKRALNLAPPPAPYAPLLPCWSVNTNPLPTPEFVDACSANQAALQAASDAAWQAKWEAARKKVWYNNL